MMSSSVIEHNGRQAPALAAYVEYYGRGSSELGVKARNYFTGAATLS